MAATLADVMASTKYATHDFYCAKRSLRKKCTTPCMPVDGPVFLAPFSLNRQAVACARTPIAHHAEDKLAFHQPSPVPRSRRSLFQRLCSIPPDPPGGLGEDPPTPSLATTTNFRLVIRLRKG